MVDLSSVSGMIPSFSGLGSKVIGTLTILVIVGVVLMAAGVGVYFLIQWLKYNKKIVLFEKVGNNWEQVGRDKATEVRYNTQGDTVFFCKKRKKYIPRPEIQTGKRIYWFAIGLDGEWRNIGLGDIDEQMRKANVKFVDADMRAFKSGLRQIMKERYEKTSFFKEYAPILIPIVFYAILVIGLYFIIDKIVAVGDKLLTMQQAGEETMKLAKQVLGSLDNVCSNSGVVK